MNGAEPAVGFGPWSATIDEGERRCRWRALAALAAVFCGPGSTLAQACLRAEHDTGASTEAANALGRLGALTRRRLLSVFALVCAPSPHR